MWIASLLFVASSVFQFSGGNANAFAAALSKATGKSVVLLADVEYEIVPAKPRPEVRWIPARIPKGEIRWEREEEILPALAKEWGLQGRVIGDVFALWARAWPDAMVHQFAKEQYLAAFQRMRPPSQSSTPTKISIETSDTEALLAADVRHLVGRQDVAVHWFYAWAYLNMKVNDAPAEDVLNAVAAALGAELRTTREGLQFAFEPKEFKKRFIARKMIDKANAGNEYQRATADFEIAAIQAFTDDELREAFRQEDGAATKQIPPEGAVMSAFRARIAAIEALHADPVARQSLLPALSNLVEMMDLSSPIQIEYVNPNGTVGAVVRAKDGRAWIHF
jgi:hypothetical protein